MQSHVKNKLDFLAQKNWDSYLAKALPWSTSLNEVLLADSIGSLVISVGKGCIYSIIDI